MGLHVCGCFEHASLNGGERSWLSLVPELLKHGIRFSAVAPGCGPLADRLRSMGIDMVPWRSGMPGERLPDLARRRQQLDQAIQQLRPDLIHANSLNIGRLLGPVVSQLGLPSIAHLRDIVKVSRQGRRDLAMHSRLLAVSHAVRQFHLAQGLPASRIHVQHNGVDLHEFRPRRGTSWLHRELSIPPESMLVGGIGQLGIRKGWDVALAAFTQVVAVHGQAQLVIVGERNSDKLETMEYVQRLHALAQTPTLRGKVHFLGRRTDVAPLMGELTLLVHPARQEPLGRVLLEGAASGLPIVATDVGGTREIFPWATQAARLVEPDQPDLLAAEIIDLLGAERARDLLGQAARQEMCRRFQLPPIAAAVHEHYISASQIRPGGVGATMGRSS